MSISTLVKLLAYCDLEVCENPYFCVFGNLRQATVRLCSTLNRSETVVQTTKVHRLPNYTPSRNMEMRPESANYHLREVDLRNLSAASFREGPNSS